MASGTGSSEPSSIAHIADPSAGGAGSDATAPFVSPLCAALFERGRGFTTERGALLAADISGFTRLTERLAGEGRAGSERLVEIVSGCFDALIAEVLARGGDVLRFGGDALFVMFAADEARAVARAASTALAIQRLLARRATITVPGGRVRLRMSMGLHVGPVTFFVRDGAHAEVLPIGPAVSETLRLQAAARQGEVLVSRAATARLPAALVERVGGRRRLRRGGRAGDDLDLDVAGPAGDVRATVPALVSGDWRALVTDAPSEHRIASVAFVSVTGTDDAVASREPLLASQLELMLSSIDELTNAFEVTYLGSDVIADGATFILIAGMPHARSDDDVRLVAAAHALVAKVPGARAGVHRGAVFAGEVGHARRRTYAVMGDTTNVAARLMSAALPGATVVSTSVAERLPRSYTLEALAPLQLKGKRRRFEACAVRVNDAQSVPSRSETPLIGRRAELRAVLRGVARAQAGQGSVVELTGPAGIGKSTVLAAALAEAPGALCVRGDPAHRLEPLGAFPRELRDIVGLSIERLVQALATAPRTPTAIIVDEVHWLDALSRIAARRLAAVARDVGWCVVIARRQDDAVILDASTRARRRVVPPMNKSELKTLIVAAATRPLTDLQLDTIVVHSYGNPLVAAQLARSGVGRTELPQDTESLIAYSLDSLTPDVRRLARDLAICGSGIDISIAREVLDLTDDALQDGMHQLDSVATVDANGHVQFTNRLVEQVAAAGAPVTRQRALHRRLATVMIGRHASARLIVDHAAAIPWHEVVLQYGAKAAEQAIEAGAHEEAMRTLRATLTAAEALRIAPGDRGAIMLALAETMIGLEQPQEAFRLYKAAIDLLDDPREQVRAATRAAGEFARLGRHRSAEVLLARAREAIGHAEPQAVPKLELLAALALSRIDFERGRYEESAAVAEDVLARAGTHDDAERGEALLQLAIDYGLIGDPRSVEVAERALPILRDLGRTRDVAALLVNLAADLDDRGDWDAAWPMYVDAERLFLEIGELPGATFSLTTRAAILIELGDVERAASMLADVDRQGRALSFDSIVAVAQVHRARITALTVSPIGQAELIESLARKLVRLGERANSVYARVWATEILLLDGRAQEALDNCDRLRRRVETLGPHVHLSTRRRRLRAFALWALGRESEACVEIDEAVVDARRRGTAPELCFCLHAAGRFGLLDTDQTRELAGLEARLGVVSYAYLPSPHDPRVRAGAGRAANAEAHTV